MAKDGLSYQELLDSMRKSVATEFLENTHLLIDQVAERVGFADATSFRRRLESGPATLQLTIAAPVSIAHRPDLSDETSR